MNWRFSVGLLAVVASGCATKPVATTETNRPTTSRAAYHQYVERRTADLQRMGGPFADREVAERKAREDAASRYGEPPPDVSTTWSWGRGAGRKQTQAEVTDTLEQAERDAMRR